MIDEIVCKVNSQIYFLVDVQDSSVRVSGLSITNIETPAVIFTAVDGAVSLVSTTLSNATTQKIQDYISEFIRPSIFQYLPSILQPFLEFQEICDTEDVEFERMYPAISTLYAETTIRYCSEERLAEWERALKVNPEGTLEQRRLFMLATIRGNGKLNEAKINSIVNAFTGGTAIVTLENSVIVVKVLPPHNGEIYLFPDIERSLSQLIPAHLGLSVIRFYSSWGDIKNNLTSWQSVKNLDDWQDVRDLIFT